jgi:hypothetical protein
VNNGTSFGTTTAPPYTASYDTTQLSNGSYTITATGTNPAGTTTATATVTVSNGSGVAGVYYITTSGNDNTNDGKTIATAWKTPNHTLNCCDTILVEPGTYPGSSFYLTFGPEGCGCQSGTFRTLKCDATNLHACIINGDLSPGYGAMTIGSPYWIIQGFEGTAPSFGSCIGSGYFPDVGAQWNGHHIVFINNYVHDCNRSSLAAAFIGAISYHTAYGYTDSGIDFYEPRMTSTPAPISLSQGRSCSRRRTDPARPTARD